MRHLLALLIILCSGMLTAQTNRTYVLEVSDGLKSYKFAIEAVRSLDPNATLAFHSPNLKVTLHNTISSEELLSALASTGAGNYVMLYSDEHLTNAPETAMPVFIDTGHPEEDMENHAAAKQAWILANPIAHQKLIESFSNQTIENE